MSARQPQADLRRVHAAVAEALERQGMLSPAEATAAHNVAVSLGHAGAPDEAAALLAEVLPSIRTQFGDQSLRALVAEANRAAFSVMAGNGSDLQALGEVERRLTAELGADHPEAARARHNLASLQRCGAEAGGGSGRSVKVSPTATGDVSASTAR